MSLENIVTELNKKWSQAEEVGLTEIEKNFIHVFMVDQIHLASQLWLKQHHILSRRIERRELQLKLLRLIMGDVEGRTTAYKISIIISHII